MGRIPSSCPPGFMGRYTVTSGDSMFRLAQFFRIPLQSLIAANPHIRVPSEIFPGDVLCAPGLVPYPCCLVLRRQRDLPTGTEATAIVFLSSQGTLQVSIVAHFPPPATFGNFDIYIASVLIPETDGGFGNELLPVELELPTYVTTVSFPTAAQLTLDTVVELRPSNSSTGADGPILLRATLHNCCRESKPQVARKRRHRRKAERKI